MAERRGRRRTAHRRGGLGGGAGRTAGFTLVEMLVALAILTLGVTSLLRALSDSVSLRRSADARSRVAESVEDLVHRIAATGIRRRADAESDLDLELALPPAVPVEGFPGLELQATMIANEQRLDVWLLQIDASWVDAGEAMTERFLRVLPRQLPLRARVDRFFGREEASRAAMASAWSGPATTEATPAQSVGRSPSAGPAGRPDGTSESQTRR